MTRRVARLRLAAGAAAASLAAACTGGGVSGEALCARLGDPARHAAVIEGFDLADPSRSLEQLAAALAELRELREVAPGALRPEIDVQIDAVRTLVGALEQVAPADEAGAVEALRAVEPELAALGASTLELERWTQENCRPA